MAFTALHNDLIEVLLELGHCLSKGVDIIIHRGRKVHQDIVEVTKFVLDVLQSFPEDQRQVGFRLGELQCFIIIRCFLLLSHLRRQKRLFLEILLLLRDINLLVVRLLVDVVEVSLPLL